MMREVLLVVVAAGLLAGCGGKVVFVEDDDGSGASGAGGAGPGPGPGPGPTSTSSGIETVCQQWCNAYGACLDEPNCVNACEGFFTGTCDPELGNLLMCIANNFSGDCDVPIASCSAEQQAYESCLNGPNDCFTEFCEDSPDGSCYCSGICFDQIKLEQQCFFPIPGDGNGGQPGPPPPPFSTAEGFTAS